MLSALTLVPAFWRVAGATCGRCRPGSGAQGRTPRRSRPARSAAATEPSSTRTAPFARWGRKVSDRPVAVGDRQPRAAGLLAIPLLSLAARPARRRHRPDLAEQPPGLRPDHPGLRPGRERAAHRGGRAAQESSDHADAAEPASPSTLAGHRRGGLGQRAVGQPGRQHRRSSTSSRRPRRTPRRPPTWSTGCATTCCPACDVTDLRRRHDAGYVDFTEKIAGRMLWLILAVVLLSLVLLTVAFRSIVIAVKAAVLNLLSVGAAYGVIVAVFQWGWGSQPARHRPGPADPGVRADADVRDRVRAVDGLRGVPAVPGARGVAPDRRRAPRVAIGIGSTARVITTAAAIMVVVFSSFVLDSDPTIKMLAVGMAVAVLIDASVVRMVLVPSMMSILDARAWYMPRWLDRSSPTCSSRAAPRPPRPQRPQRPQRLPHRHPPAAAQTKAATDAKTEAETKAEAKSSRAATETATESGNRAREGNRGRRRKPRLRRKPRPRRRPRPGFGARRPRNKPRGPGSARREAAGPGRGTGNPGPPPTDATGIDVNSITT